MTKRELYQQKLQAQLDEWKADLDKLKARESGASADAQLEWKAQIAALQGQIETGTAKMSELAGASEDAWESTKEGVESAWASLKSTVSSLISGSSDKS